MCEAGIWAAGTLERSDDYVQLGVLQLEVEWLIDGLDHRFIGKGLRHLSFQSSKE